MTSTYIGFIWELKKSLNNKYVVVSIRWFDSFLHQELYDEYFTIFISEPIQNVTDETRTYVMNNLDKFKKIPIIHNENTEWILRLP